MSDFIKKKINKYGFRVLAICFWLLLWEIASIRIKQEILLASPVSVFMTLLGFIKTPDFWQTILFSFIRIVSGFFLALVVGTIMAVLSYNSRLIRELFSPLFHVIKSIPVASFIILALVWIKARNLSVLISFFMVVPIVYINMEQGLKSVDEKLLQMARIFRIGKLQKIKAIYIPAVMPYFISAISVGMGFAWKSGIAAEVIGIPVGSIGEKLYEAKLYLMTKELFAWTVVIIIVSVVFEKAVMFLIHLLHHSPEDMLKQSRRREGNTI